MTVTFFGHRRTPDSVKPLLKETLRELIEKDRADMFYVGNEGSFDCIRYLEGAKDRISFYKL